MKDDRILKPRLRSCPFCGAAGHPELMRSGAAAFVRCNVCRAEGPWYDICEYLPEDFHDMDGMDQDRAWANAEIEAKKSALLDWNRRPWEGAYFPDELEQLEANTNRRRMCDEAEPSNTTNAHNALKLEGGALYGRSVH